MLDSFLLEGLIKELPSLQILLLFDKKRDAIEIISQRVAAFDGSCDLCLLQNELFLPPENVVLIEESSLFSKMQHHSRRYEMAFVVAPPLEQERLERLYHTLENSGEYVQIFKKEQVDVWAEKGRFEEANFVAINDTEIDKKYVMITAKKMHGWSGGT